MLSGAQKIWNLLSQHPYPKAAAEQAPVSYISKQKNDRLEVSRVMARQKELRVMNNRWEMEGGERSRRGDAGDQCPEERKNQTEMKKICVVQRHLRAWGYDRFLLNKRRFFPGENFNNMQQIQHATLRRSSDFFKLFFLRWWFPVDALKLSDGEKIGWGVGWWWSPHCQSACTTTSSDF